ncbi:MAG: anion-transporting ArsA/GET3 family ATPase [Hyphomicrobiaceae bacterium]|jgi:anion-transporting  ArsA/GET3 family ATPase
MNLLDEFIRDRRLIVLVGEGGVGKTSVAASLALAAAESGRRTAVLTVDPAPRLGDALGLGPIGGHPQMVPLASGAKGSLVAMRLDGKGTFDRMVEKFAADPERAQELLANPIYHTLSGSLGGSEHYMAFQRLYELAESDQYDLLVVDTPPAANARDLLSAPSRLTDLLDSGAMSILAEPARILARAGSAIVRASFSLILAVLKRVAGSSLQQQVSEFVALFDDLLAGLADRAKAIEALLRADTTAFVLVARPRPDSVTTTIEFRNALAEAGIQADALVINRMTPRRPTDRAQARSKRLSGAPEGALDAITVMEREMDALRSLEAEAVTHLRQRAGGAQVLPIAALDSDVSTLHDIRGIAARALAKPAA